MYIVIVIYNNPEPESRTRKPDPEQKKGSSKAPLFPPTILATIGNLNNRCNYLFDTQDHPRSSLRNLHQPSRCFLVYLDNSFLPPILSFNLFPVTLPVGFVFLFG